MQSARSFSFVPRDRLEAHRASTPLELMFDLATVIAIAAAAHGLSHAIGEGHFIEGIIGFLCGFFMIWWAWMNYTWFASAYDDGSSTFRALTMVIMFGALMLAAGIGAVFDHQRIWLALLGFIVMRLGMALFWLGAARGDPERRQTALRFAGGISVMQIYWTLLVILVSPAAILYLPLFLVGVAGELSVPALAERRGITTWHRGHIIERYSLLNIIVLGESFLAIIAMIHLESGIAMPDPGHLWLAAMSTIIAFSLWSVYFAEGDHLTGDDLRHALLWGYGHFALFAAGAATGAGMAVLFGVANHSVHVGPQVGILALAIPVAVYLATLRAVRDRINLNGARRWLLLGAAVLVLLFGALAPLGVELIAALLIITALVRNNFSATMEITS